jgi:hypothetical protein
MWGKFMHSSLQRIKRIAEPNLYAGIPQIGETQPLTPGREDPDSEYANRQK